MALRETTTKARRYTAGRRVKGAVIERPRRVIRRSNVSFLVPWIVSMGCDHEASLDRIEGELRANQPSPEMPSGSSPPSRSAGDQTKVDAQDDGSSGASPMTVAVSVTHD